MQPLRQDKEASYLFDQFERDVVQLSLRPLCVLCAPAVSLYFHRRVAEDLERVGGIREQGEPHSLVGRT